LIAQAADRFVPVLLVLGAGAFMMAASAAESKPVDRTAWHRSWATVSGSGAIASLSWTILLVATIALILSAVVAVAA
jgi:hypothetical protein